MARGKQLAANTKAATRAKAASRAGKAKGSMSRPAKIKQAELQIKKMKAKVSAMKKALKSNAKKKRVYSSI